MQSKSCMEWDEFVGLKISSDEVHIWSASVDVTPSRIETLSHVLSPDEVKRANRYYFERDTNRYIIARGVLRHILSRYCNRHPGELKFVYNEYGKPALAGHDMLRFNVSHSGEQVLYGISWGREIGVDIERVRPFKTARQIVDKYFSDYERKEFYCVPDQLKDEAFFACWTRKEAYIKAQGMGLSLPLNQFSISFLPNEPARLIETRHDKREKKRWSLKEIIVNAGYMAAAVIEGHGYLFKNLKWAWEPAI